MDRKWKILITVLVVVYALCPDLLPGPIDDLLVIIAGLLANEKLALGETNEHQD